MAKFDNWGSSMNEWMSNIPRDYDFKAHCQSIGIIADVRAVVLVGALSICYECCCTCTLYIPENPSR